MNEKVFLKWFLTIVGGIIALLLAAAILSATVRGCVKANAEKYKVTVETSIYEYGASLNPEAKIVLASKKSGFLIPKELAKKLILGIKSTTRLQVVCDAQINYYIDAEDLRGAEYEWSADRKKLDITVNLPRAMRPIIETSSIKLAVLKSGWAFNERAELDTLLNELSGRVADMAGTTPDTQTLEVARKSLIDLTMAALSKMKGRNPAITINWTKKNQ
jgi:hypothetical protein